MKTMNAKTARGAEYYSQDERDEAQDGYEHRISAIKKLAEEQAKGVMDQGKRDAQSVGRGLSNLDELLQK
jgi:hypothetical protein